MRSGMAIGSAFATSLIGAAPASAQVIGPKFQVCVTSDQQNIHVRVGDKEVNGKAGTGRRCVDRSYLDSGRVVVGHQFGTYADCGVDVPLYNLIAIELQYQVVANAARKGLDISCHP